MNHSIKVGVNFGLSSGVITTLGLMVGLGSGTSSKAIVAGGVLTIAVADAFSDSLGIHLSEESEGKHTSKEIWQSTIATWITKFVMASSFLIPIVLFPLTTALWVSIAWGLAVLTAMSYRMARSEKSNPLHVIFEHVSIAILVVIVTHLLGDFIARTFG